MARVIVLTIYNLLLPVFFIIAFPAWLVKMWKRGGYGTGLKQRFALFDEPAELEPKGGVYIHAVSVGEVLIALKLIHTWLENYPEQKFILSATTSTGHDVARKNSPESVRVIYSPLDFGLIVRAVFRRFQPQQIILTEAEAWPNLLNVARKSHLPVSMINARLSARSEARYQKLKCLVKPLFEMIGKICVQNEEDAERFKNLGISPEKIHVTGSIKFDPDAGAAATPTRRAEFSEILSEFGQDRKVVLAASTHAGEEKLLGAELLASKTNALFLVVPRHAERRAEVVADLESLGFEVVLRSNYHTPANPEKACFVADTTGELRDWTAHADLVMIGKSWLGKGGQNPAEAITARVPVMAGPYMGNFQPLVSELEREGGIEIVSEVVKIRDSISRLLSEDAYVSAMTEQAVRVLNSHREATLRTIKRLH